MPNKLASALLATLTYSDHFHFPLTFSELHTRLIQYQVTASTLRRALTPLLKTGVIETRSSYYFLPQQGSLVHRRRLYARLSRPLFLFAQSLVPTLVRVPGIRALYLTGSLALSNTDGHDDIDLMVITEPGRLWTTRALLTLYTQLLALRRHPSSRNSIGKLCLNLYLTPSSFALPPTRRSLYTAYELIQAKPLYDPTHTHAQLLTANSWLKDYLPNYPLPTPAPPPLRHSTPASLLETLAYTLQYLYMRPRITREYITKEAAFFHPNNPGTQVLRKINL